MKFYQAFDPYFALIKAKNKESAKSIYTSNVAEDLDGLLINNLEEVERDTAIAMYSRAMYEDGDAIPVKEIVNDVQNEEEFCMLIEGTLI